MLHDRKTAQIVVNCSQEISTFKLKIKTLIHVHINGLFHVCSQFDRVIIKKSHGFIIIKKNLRTGESVQLVNHHCLHTGYTSFAC